jgi:uncharacterized protein YecT (DUF1311 family)
MATAKRRYPLLAFSLLLLGSIAAIPLSRPTQAQTDSQSDPQVDCQNANDTPSINYCAGVAYEQADQLLNQTYQQLLSTLSNADQEKLRTTQQDWIDYRDKNCDFEVRNSIGGTGYPAYLSGCLQRMTQERTRELEKQRGQRG